MQLHTHSRGICKLMKQKHEADATHVSEKFCDGYMYVQEWVVVMVCKHQNLPFSIAQWGQVSETYVFQY